MILSLPALFAVHEAPVPSIFWAIPFAILLLAIAALPLSSKHSHWWEHHHNKLILGLGLSSIVLCYYAFRGYGLAGEGS